MTWYPETASRRWFICGLLFLATALNYVDRAVLGILKPLIDADLRWSQVDYGWVVTFFQLAYAAGYAFSGRVVDRIGVRRGMLLAVGVWSCAAAGHAFVRTVAAFCVMRALLGLAEGGSFPAAVKAVAEWFPKQERTLATGVFNTGSNAGAILCPLLVSWIAPRWGWPGAFFLTGALGWFWVALWLRSYTTPKLRFEGLEKQANLSYRTLLFHRQTWAFMVGMAASSPIWWFYIFWIPDFLSRRFALTLTATSLPLVTIFLTSSVGGVAGGWLPSALLKRGFSLNAARKTALVACALCVVPVSLTPLVQNLWSAVALVSLAAAAHCGFAANLFTFASDVAPQRAVGSIVGLGGMAGSLAGMGFAQVVSRVLEATGNNYMLPFCWASGVYLAACLIMHVLSPSMERMELPD